MKVDEKFDSLQDDDIDDVIGIAAELMQADDDALDRSEMIAVGRDLDIPEDYLDRAYAQLQTQRKAAAKQTRREEGRRRRLMTLGGTGVAGVIFILAMWGTFSLNGLSKLHAQVEAQRAQVQNVRDRANATNERWGGKPDTPDKMAALDGAENRIRVETKRYGEAAAAYNTRASGFPTSMFVDFSDLPESVPPAL